MTRDEAKHALVCGKTLTHEYFMDHETVRQVSTNHVLFEDGVVQKSADFWKMKDVEGWGKGWSIVETPTIQP